MKKQSNVVPVYHKKAMGIAPVFQPRIRNENEALPNQVNKMAGIYIPPTYHIRSGGEDHLKYKSRGV